MENLKKKKPKKTVNRVKTSGAVKMPKRKDKIFITRSYRMILRAPELFNRAFRVQRGEKTTIEIDLFKRVKMK